MSGKTIRLYLTEGEPGGVMTAEIINWTGKMIVAPRSKLPELVKRVETGCAGIYLLVGDDPDDLARKRVYIGESDNVSERLKNHQADKSKDFWTHTALVISKDGNLTKSHVRYLESRLVEVIGNAKRANLANGTNPMTRSLPEPEVVDMEFFLAQVRVLLPVLGFPFAQSAPAPTKGKPSPKSEDVEAGIDDTSPLFYMNPVGTYATAQEIDDEFVVLEGSTARKKGTSSWTSYRALREQLVQDGKLIEDKQQDLLTFTEDVPFSSPSAAAAVLFGGNQNGRLVWKTESGKTYAKWQEEKLEQASIEPAPPGDTASTSDQSKG